MLRRTFFWSETLEVCEFLISWTVDRVTHATGLEVILLLNSWTVDRFLLATCLEVLIIVALAFDAEATSLAAFFALGTLLVGGLVGSKLMGCAWALRGG